MIPKKLHYVWLGNPLSDIEKKWMETSIKNNPNLEHKIWGYESVKPCKFLDIALKEKKFAYAADYIRLCVLLEEGGFYVDTDVELLKEIPKNWFKYENVLPKETDYKLGGHFIGSVKHSRFIYSLLQKYRNFTGDTIKKEDWVIPKLLKEQSIKTFGKYSIQNHKDGTFKSSKRLLNISFDEMCPFYPWDKKRIQEHISLENTIGVHYCKTYMSNNNLEFGSFTSKHFDNE